MNTACLIIYRLGVGGAEQMVVAEARELLRRGYKVRLITLNPERTQTLMTFLPQECEREMVVFTSILDIRALRKLAYSLKRLQPDIIITQLWYANTVGRIAARIAGVDQRLVAFEQNVYDRVKTWKQFLLDRILQGWCARIVAISESVRASLVRHGIRSDRVIIVHNAIDLERFRSEAIAPIRDELGIGDAFVYLMVGRLVPQKAVDILLPAFAAQDNGVLLIAGDGEDRERLELQANELGIRNRVYFLGIRHDVPALMRAADCFVLASRWEGFGVVFAEAMAAGLPVVATRVDGIREVVEDGVSGILVQSDEVAPLASAMREIRTDDSLRERLAKAAPDRARLFAIDAHVDRLLPLVSL